MSRKPFRRPEGDVAPSARTGAGQRIRIGEWMVEPAANQVERGTEVVRVEPRAMDVLVLLAAYPGQVVTRDRLFAAVWPGVIVGDEALTQSVIKLRRALGDRARAPAYIETIAKRGYRLIAPISYESPAGTRDSETGSLPPASSRPGQARRLLWLAAGAIAVVLAVTGYRVVAPLATHGPALDVPSVRETEWVTVTVAPFESATPGADDANLAQGIGDDLLADLSRVSGLRLIRQGGAASAAPAARARYTVSGTVRRDGDALRINVFLVDGTTHEQLWAGRFERRYRDLFAVQDEVTRKVLTVLPAKVGETERQRAAKRYTHSLAAWEAFQSAQAAFLVRSSADNAEARALYRRAIQLDPTFARAYASLAMTYAMDYRLGTAGEPSQALARAFELAETARQIDPAIPQVYWALGFVHAQARRHAEASNALERAIELDPSYADAYALLGGIRTYVGQPKESIPLLRTAMRLDPEGGYLYYLLLGRAYLFSNDLEQALINLHEANQRNPVDVETRVFLAAALAAKGDLESARWQAEEIRTLQPAFSATAWLDTYPMTSIAQRERLLALLRSIPI